MKKSTSLVDFIEIDYIMENDSSPSSAHELAYRHMYYVYYQGANH